MTTRLTAVLARRGYLLAVAAIGLSTAIFLPGRDSFATGQWALLYLLVILLVASVAGTGPAVVAAALAFFAWNFFFLPPYHTLAIHDPKDWLFLAAFLVVGVIVGVQTGRMREREARALARERETSALQRLSAGLVAQSSTEQMAESCLKEAVNLLGAHSATLLVAVGGEVHTFHEPASAGQPDAALAAEALEAYLRAHLADSDAGAGPDDEAPPAGGLFAPVRTTAGVMGALAIESRLDGRAYSASDARLATSLANLVGAFLERERLQQAASAAAAEREADQLKSSLLSSVSHELKTPLAALTATVSNLLEADVDWDERSVRDELRAIVGDVDRLSNSINSLLELSRLEAHAWEPRRETYDLGEIVAAGITALPAHLRSRVVVDLPDEAPLVDVDFVQWTRVIQSLLENALLYAGDGPVSVGATKDPGGLRVWVEDRGPGVPASEKQAVFEKFYRGRVTAGQGPSGTGLGLSIAREIVRSHGGAIHVEDVQPHGARFVISLPWTTTAERKEEP